MKKFLCGTMLACFALVAAGCGAGNTASVDEGYSKSAPADPATKGPVGAGPTGDESSAAAPPPPPPEP